MNQLTHLSVLCFILKFLNQNIFILTAEYIYTTIGNLSCLQQSSSRQQKNGKNMFLNHSQVCVLSFRTTVDLMLGNRLRRWPSIKLTLVPGLVFAA